MRRLVVALAILALGAAALSWAMADDQDIAKKITEQLKKEQKAGNLKNFDINLKVAEGNVVLKGRVASENHQKLVADIARQTQGVQQVVNELEVKTADAKPPVAASPAPTLPEAATASNEREKEPEKAKDKSKDNEIAAEIAKKLREHKEAGRLKGFRIDVNVDGGTVFVKGTVSSAEQRKLALDAAQATSWVDRVVDELMVRAPKTETADASGAAPSSVPEASNAATTPPPTVPQPTAQPEPARQAQSDRTIAEQIAKALTQEEEAGNLQGVAFDLTVNDAVAVLDGRVRDARQLQLALQTARNTPGVRDVVNHLVVSETVSEPAAQTAKSDLPTPATVEPAKARTAEYLHPANEPAEQVENALYRNNGQQAEGSQLAVDRRIGDELTRKLQEAKQRGNLRGFGIGVQVDNGSVWLKGRVSSREQLELALDLARHIPDVRQVVNGLSISESVPAATSSPTPQAIAQELGQRLEAAEASGELRGANLDVSVDGGNVWLSGSALSAEQEQVAVNLARHVPGVQRVISSIAVGEDPRAVEPRMPPAPTWTNTTPPPLLANTSPTVPALAPTTPPAPMLANTSPSAPIWANTTPPAPMPANTSPSAPALANITPPAPMLANTPLPTATLASPPAPAEPMAPSLDEAAALQTPFASEPVAATNAAFRPAVAQLSRQQFRRDDASSTVERAAPTPVGQPTMAMEASAISTPAMTSTPPSAVQWLPRPAPAMPATLTTSSPAPENTSTLNATSAPVVYVMPPAVTAAPMTAPYYVVQPAPAPAATVNQTPRPLGATQLASYAGAAMAAPVVMMGQAIGVGPGMPPAAVAPAVPAAGMGPACLPGPGAAAVPSRYDQPYLPGYAWPTYAAYPNYAAVTYPRQYSPTAWPYIGPFYPYPQVPLGWRKVTLKWDDGWWNLDFKAK